MRATPSSPTSHRSPRGLASLRATLRPLVAAFLGLAVALALPTTAAAQQADSARAGVRAGADSARRVIPQRARRDSLDAPVSPGRAFLLSLALPGLGQSKLNRPTAGAVYFAAEAVSLAMLAKSANDLRIAKLRVRDTLVWNYRRDPTTGAPVTCDSCSGLRFEADTVIVSRFGEAVDEEQLRTRVKARRLHFEDWIATLVFIHLFSGADAFVSSQLWDLPAQIELRALPRGAVGVGASLKFR